jgi:hypothetical protein
MPPIVTLIISAYLMISCVEQKMTLGERTREGRNADQRSGLQCAGASGRTQALSETMISLRAEFNQLGLMHIAAIKWRVKQ